MLNTSKQTTIDGSSTIDGKVVATMHANLKNYSVSKSIVDKDMYESNKEAVRSDFEEFEKLVYDAEDKEV